MAVTHTTNGQLDAQLAAPKYGTLIPNRIFVGGIRWASGYIDPFAIVSNKSIIINVLIWFFLSVTFSYFQWKFNSGDTTEAELCRVFSSYGNVKSTKIIVDRAGVSKGYGFVTFETEQEAQRLQADVSIWFDSKRLNMIENWVFFFF